MSGRIYIGSLLYQVQPEEILQIFEGNNIAIDKLDMSIDPFSGRNPSYCFVDLADRESLDDVLQRLQGVLVRGRPIRVNRSTRKRQQRTGGMKTEDQFGRWRTIELPNKSSNVPTFAFDRWTRTDARDHWTNSVDEGRRLFVGGLSDISNQSFVNREMQQLFEGYDIQAVSKRILPAHRDASIPATGQCYCFVDLPSAEEAGRATMMLNGKPTPYGGVYKVNRAYPQANRKVCREHDKLLGIHRVVGQPRRDLSSDWRSRT